MYTINGQDELRNKLISLEGRLLDVCLSDGLVINHHFYLTKTIKPKSNCVINGSIFTAVNDFEPLFDVGEGVKFVRINHCMFTGFNQ